MSSYQKRKLDELRQLIDESPEPPKAEQSDLQEKIKKLEFVVKTQQDFINQLITELTK